MIEPPHIKTRTNEAGMTQQQQKLFHTLVDAGTLESVALDTPMLIE